MTAPTTSGEPAATHRREIEVPAWVLIVIGGLILLGLGFGVGRWTDDGAQRGFEGPQNFGDHGGDHGCRGWGLLVLVVLIALIVFAGVLLYRHFSDRRPGTSSAEDVLAGRFARGEIDAAEYRERRDALREYRQG